MFERVEVRGKGGSRPQKIFSTSLVVQEERETTRVVFGGRCRMWKSSFKRRVLKFKSRWEDQVEGLRTTSPYLIGPLWSSPNLTTAFNTAHSPSGYTFPGLQGTTFSIFLFILWRLFLSNPARCLLNIAHPNGIPPSYDRGPIFPHDHSARQSCPHP